MDCSPPGSSVHGIFQARVLEWVAIAFSKISPSFNQKCQIRLLCSPSLQLLRSLPTSTMTPLLFYVIATRLNILTSFPPLEKMGKC